jgi:hypothetical protein
MKARKIPTIILLVFIGASIIYLIFDRIGTSPEVGVGDTITAVDIPQLIKAYYFHATKRCRTCLEIERLADDVVTAEFRDDLDAGTITWDIVNYESPGNEHFVEDYGLMYSSLILVKYENGRETGWTNLEKVWDLVWQPEAFSAYVSDEIRSLLDRPEAANSAFDEKL